MSSALDNMEKGLNIAKESVNFLENILNKIPQYRANALLIKEIEESSDLTTAEKMALLYDHKKIKREIKNLASTYSLTELYLNEKKKSLENEIPLLNEDWFDYYNDVVKNVSDKEIQTIWAKILAGECENKGSISKKTISIIQTIDSDMAKKFSYLCSHSLIFCDKEFTHKSIKPIFPKILTDQYDNPIINNFILSIPINNIDLFDLQMIGLITYDTTNTGIFYLDSKERISFYYGTKLYITSKYDIPTGKISYTKYGVELAWLLHEDLKKQKDDKYIEFVKNYMRELDSSIEFRE